MSRFAPAQVTTFITVSPGDLSSGAGNNRAHRIYRGRLLTRYESIHAAFCVEVCQFSYFENNALGNTADHAIRCASCQPTSPRITVENWSLFSQI